MSPRSKSRLAAETRSRRSQAKREIAAVEKALRKGFAPIGRGGQGVRSALGVAAEALGQPQSGPLGRRVGLPGRPGQWHREFGLAPNWQLYTAPPASSPIEQAREQRDRRDLVAENKRLTEQLVEAQDIRGGVLKLVREPLRPELVELPRVTKSKGARTVIVHLSDLHCGERVSLAEMDGLNSYSIEIFQKRMARLGEAVRALTVEHWTGTPPERLVLILGGDLISGEIHDELAKTNEALSAPAVRAAVGAIAGLIKKLLAINPRLLVDVYSVPGNHGRLTKKPESKGMATNSFDALVAEVVEMMLAGHKRVRFIHSKSGDLLFRLYGFTFVVAHGDRIGSRGGQGFIGPVATIARGLAKVRSYYQPQGVIVDHVLIGHFHTTSKMPRGISNGSLVGPSEYSRDLRADPEPAKQNMLVVHSERGLIDWRELSVGAADEGSIYRARA